MLTYILIGLVVGFVLNIIIKSMGGKNYNNLSVNDLQSLMKDRNTILIDVRTPKEVRQGKIGKPLEIELGAGMDQKFEKLDRNKKYVLYCRSGQRSAFASNKMAKLGFEDVNNLQGGYLAWNNR